MLFEEMKELVSARQACRAFSDKPIEKSVIESIVKTAKLSPSACNSQPWKMYCAISYEAVKGVKESLTDEGRNSFLENAKAYIVLAEKIVPLPPEKKSSRFQDGHFVPYDVGLLCAHIILIAKSMGVDSCVIGWINEKKLKKAVGLSDGENCKIVVALGYSETDTRLKNRKSDDETIKYI